MYPRDSVKIGLGSTCIEIGCSDQEFMRKLRTNYQSFAISRRPDFRIIFNIFDGLKASEIKQILGDPRSRSYVKSGRFFTEPRFLEFHVDWSETVLEVDVERELFAPELDYKLMNVLLRGIYSGIHRRIRNVSPDAYLVHGCGIADDKRCYLFTGFSGAGKTTIANLASGRKVLNDEMVLIERNSKRFHISGTPFEGGMPDRCMSTGNLSAIFFLKHCKEVSIRQLTAAETYQKLLYQVLYMLPILETPSIEYTSQRADLCAEISAQVPSFELGFRPDPSFWQAIDKI